MLQFLLVTNELTDMSSFGPLYTFPLVYTNAGGDYAHHSRGQKKSNEQTYNGNADEKALQNGATVNRSSLDAPAFTLVCLVQETRRTTKSMEHRSASK